MVQGAGLRLGLDPNLGRGLAGHVGLCRRDRVRSAWLYFSRLRDGADPPTATILYLLWIAVSVAALIAVAWATGERPRWRWGR